MWTAIRSCSSVDGWMRPCAPRLMNQPRWHWRPRAPMARPRYGWCCSKVSTSAVSRSSPTIAGRELEANPRAEFCIHWKELERQIRVFGAVERLSVIESARYFASRPLESCLGAWASLQSSVLGHRKELEDRLEETRQRFGDKIPHPPHWGGFRVIPQRIEFWQGRPSRLHDRLCFRKASTGWEIVRLSP
jgi:pyridoxamine-phosphate oxidase